MRIITARPDRFVPCPKKGMPEKKQPKPLAKVSERKKKREAEEKPESLTQWFLARRKEMTGWCKCGCGMPSQKMSDKFFTFCACHIYPKNRFSSVRTSPLNFIEMAFIGGCHTNMDCQSMSKWPGMECWPEIKAKALAMEKYLTDEERKEKFYLSLKTLIENN